MKKIVFPLIFVQIIIAAFLAVKIYKQKTNALGEITYSPIQREDTVSNPNSKLKFFYEPVANVTEDNIIPPTTSKAYSTINSDHLNERYEYSVEKPANTCRIVTLGDSFTYGEYVNTAENYSEKLEELLHKSLSDNQKAEVINLGVGGYDIQYAVERYLLRGEKYNPDIILWLLKDDDFSDIREFTLERADYYYMEMGSENMDQLGQVGIYPYMEKASQELLDTYGKDGILDYQKEQIERLVSHTDDKLVFLLFGDIDEEYERLIKELVEAHPETTTHFKLPNFFEENPETKLPDGHPSVLGHEVIAKLIFEYLLEESLVPCN